MTTTNGDNVKNLDHHADVKGRAGPMIVDLGKQSRRKVKSLLQGEGKLMDDVRDCIAELRRTDKISSTAEAIVIVVRQKEPKARVRWPF